MGLPASGRQCAAVFLSRSWPVGHCWMSISHLGVVSCPWSVVRCGENSRTTCVGRRTSRGIRAGPLPGDCTSGLSRRRSIRSVGFPAQNFLGEPGQIGNGRGALVVVRQTIQESLVIRGDVAVHVGLGLDQRRDRHDQPHRLNVAEPLLMRDYSGSFAIALTPSPARGTPSRPARFVGPSPDTRRESDPARFQVPFEATSRLAQ